MGRESPDPRTGRARSENLTRPRSSTTPTQTGSPSHRIGGLGTHSRAYPIDRRDLRERMKRRNGIPGATVCAGQSRRRCRQSGPRAFALLAVFLLVSLAFAPMSASLVGSTESRDVPDLAAKAKPPNGFAVDGVLGGTATLLVVVPLVGSDGQTNVYVYSGLSVIYETNPATTYVFAGGMRLAKITDTTTEYYHYDHLGNVLATLAYKPFGLAVVVFGSEPKYGYTGAYRESAPNLIYLHSRWYDPTIGRFLSPDDRLGKQSMPQDQNRYAYVVNNPMAYTDPTGHVFFLGFLVLLYAATATGAIVGSVVHGATCGNACTNAGYTAAIVGGAAAGAAGFLLPFALPGAGLLTALLVGAVSNVAAYMAGSVAGGMPITPEGLFVAGLTGAGLAGLGWGIGKAVGRLLLKPPQGAVTQTGSRAAIAGDDAAGAAREALPDDGVLVVRGGGNPKTGRPILGRLMADEADGISVNSAPGRSVAELAADLPNSYVSVTTRGALRQAGAHLVPDAQMGKPFHYLVFPGRGGSPAIADIWTVVRNPRFQP